ncbi:unnamed protein product [Schistosoma turkestanicum]|nr:unnamed protein product [Schistosoma turkestanicum]
MSTMKNPTSLKTTHRPQGLAAWFELFVILRIISILCFVSIITGPFLTEITKQTCLIQIPTNQSHLYKFIELFWSNQCRHYSRQYCPLMIIYAQHFSLSITGQMWFTCLLFCLQFLIVIRTGWRIRSQQQQPYYSRCRRRHRHYSMYHDGLKSLILLYDISMLLISINILLPSILTMDSKLMKLILSNNSLIIHVACFSVILIFLLFIVIAYGTKIWLSFFLKDFLSQQKQLKTKWPIHTTTNTTTNNNNSSNNITFTTSRSINDGDDNTMSYYSTPSSNCQSLNSSRKSLEDQLAATKLYTTSNYSNQTVFRPSVLTTNHHSQTSSPRSNSCSSCSSSSIIDSQRYSTTHSPHSFISSNHFNNNNRMKQHHQNMQLQSYPCNEEDTLSVLSYRNNPCKLKHDPTMDYHHADQCHHHHHHDPVSDDYSFMHSLAVAAKRKSSHSSLKRKRRTGLIHFILCLLFGRLETWKDVCYELTCLANAIFLSIIIYCTCRIMFCLMNTFGI